MHSSSDEHLKFNVKSNGEGFLVDGRKVFISSSGIFEILYWLEFLIFDATGFPAVTTFLVEKS